jgi:hypothetical protein
LSLWPVVADGGVWRRTDVESRATGRLRLPVDPGAVDPTPGTNTAVIRAGDPDAANDVWQVAIGLEGMMASPAQPGMATPPFWKVIVPDGEPVPLLTFASNVTGWLVTREVEEATSDVLLGLDDWMRVACPGRAEGTDSSVAVMVVVVVERTTVLVIVTLHVPVESVVQDLELNETGAPPALKPTNSPGNGCDWASVTVAVAAVVELPSPRMVGGFSDSVTFAAAPGISVRVS